ncbi:MAG: polysaccharide pyruvyl transferase family protein [Sedimentisphaerales bacterium]|nr:polysaccharide pyruvyl transferase family protein [Sedimentisphaerales bacterium]
MNVLVINQCSTNKGDRAVLYFVLRELKANGIDNVTVSASNPQYWHDKPDFPNIEVRVIPWGWDVSRRKDAGFLVKVFHLFLKVKLPRFIYFPLVRDALISGKRPWYLRLLVNKRYLEAVEKADLVISTGGHHLTTIIAGHIKTPQIFDMAIALLYNKPLLLWSQSIGTFKYMSPANKTMIRKILSGAERIFIRDEASLHEIEKIEVSSEKVLKTGESVFGLYAVVTSRIIPGKREPVIGISVWTGNKQNPQAWEAYTLCFAELINHALEKHGYEQVRFFPMELQGSDRSCIEDIIKRVRKKECCRIVEDFPGTLEHINLISQCRMFVGHKTHSQIFSLAAGTPLLAIAYHKKTEDFMTQFGLEQYCISDSQLGDRKLIEIFDNINENFDQISITQQETAQKMYEKVRDDFSKMIQYFKKSGKKS